MKFGMINNPANDIYEELRFAGENKFDFIDLTIEPPKAQIENINTKKVLALCKRYNLEIIGHTNFYLPWASPIRRLRKASLEELAEHIKLFSALGTKFVNIHSHWYQPNSSKEEIIERNIESLIELVTVAKKNNIKLMLEHQPNGFLSTPESLIPIFKKVKGLLFHLDVGHAQVAGGGRNLTKDFLIRFGNKLSHVHFSDNKGSNDDHLPIESGVIDWDNIIKLLKKIGYDKTITLEVFVKDRNYLLESRAKIIKLWRNNI